MNIENKKISRPSDLLLLLEGRTVLELASYFMTMPFLMNMPSFPKGDGHPILVFPGFMASDMSTQVLRSFLNQLNYKAYAWKLGRNYAHFDELENLMIERVKWIRKHHQEKISLIGWSLGGVFAREIAKKTPQDIRQVITLGSPFGGIGEESNANWIYEWVSGKKVKEIDPQLVHQAKTPPPVPTTNIFTRTDGIVDWQTCIDEIEGEQNENIEVLGSHCGLGHNPFVLMHIAERLAQPENKWQPYRKKYAL